MSKSTSAFSCATGTFGAYFTSMAWQVWERDEKDLVYSQLRIFRAKSVHRLSNISAMLTLSLLIPYISSEP